MRIRKYSMEGRRAVQLKRLLRSDKIQVNRITVAAHDKKADSVYVFFNHVEEENAKETETLKRLKKVAKKVSKDKIYAKLTNSKQRELYLLDHYGLSKKESVDVMELVKMIELEATSKKGGEEEG